MDAISPVSARRFFGALLGFGLVWFSIRATAQEVARPSISRQKAAAQTLDRYYNLKLGPAFFNLSDSLGIEFVDNVNLSSTAPESDLILTPQFSIDAQWPMTKTNTLHLATSFGYTKYLEHPELDTKNLLVSPDSAISFDVFVGNLKITFFDQFSYQQDPISQSDLSNVSSFGRFTNDARINLLWDLNKAILNLAYDHVDFITTSTNLNSTPESTFTATVLVPQTKTKQVVVIGGPFGTRTVTEKVTASPKHRTVTISTPAAPQDLSALDYTADQISASVLTFPTSTLGVGLESAASVRRYSQSQDQDATIFSIGPFVEWQVSHYTKLFASGGIQQVSQKTQTSATPVVATAASLFRTTAALRDTSDVSNNSDSGSSYYANLGAIHRLNRFYSDQLTIGHETQVGLFSEQLQVTSLSYSANWLVSPRVNLLIGLDLDHVTESGALALQNSYNRFLFTLQTGYQITKRLSASVIYQFTDKIAMPTDQSYVQNRLGIMFNYRF